MTNKQKQLIDAYQEMHSMTLPECECTCRVPYSCCDPMACEMAIRHAKESWGITLEHTGHPRLPLMEEGRGCIAEPHLRPNCTVHTCQINSFGYKPNDPDWTGRYFLLREQIEDLEMKVLAEREGVEDDAEDDNGTPGDDSSGSGEEG